jgi:serine/threonine protein kinase
MGVHIEARAEPIPGYRLIERLGGGGFGEVWKAEAPGGLFKAIKFVFGNLSVAGEDGNRAEQELKGLSRVKTVHHPYILSLERYDIIDGQLIIVMELADRTIWDRFQECRGQGLPGIPRGELLQYLMETAEALDLMNIEYQLQHLDIKPQNLFLSHNHVKVADFGLVKDLEGMNGATVTGGVTPVYAAPETFDGRVSRFSDQYSLAIVYQELLTGVRPFTGSTMRQLVLQHLQGTPDLSSLPMADRPVIMRGLAKTPDDRYPTCTELIKSLGIIKKAEALAAAPIISKEKPSLDDQQPTRGVRSKKDRLADEAEAEKERQEANPAGQAPSAPAAEGRESTSANLLLAAVASVPMGPRPKTVFEGDKTPGGPPHHRAASQTAPPQPERVSAKAAEPHPQDNGILQPAVVIGLGRMGIDTIKQIRKLLSAEFGATEPLPHIRFIALDTDPEAIQGASQGDEQGRLRLNEVLHTPLRRPSHYLKHDTSGLTDGWLDPRMIYRIPRQPTHSGTRSLGRLAFVDNYRTIARRLEAELQACCSEDTLHEVEQHSDVGLRTRVPRIYVVTNLAGTTGGGMFIDLAYVMRQMLRRQGNNNAEVVGVFYLPPVGDDPVRRRALANTYAALKELQYYSSGEAVFRARYASPEGGNMKAFTEAGPPYQRSYLLKLPEPKPGTLSSVQDATEVVQQAGEYIFRDLATSLGKELDSRRSAQQTLGASFCSVGLYRLVWPRRLIMEQAGRNLCKRLIDRWLSKDASAQSEEIRTWSHEEWETQGFRVEDLIAQHHEKCEKLLKQAPEKMYMNIIAPLAEQMGKLHEGERLNIGPAVQAMDQIEKLLGIPEECRPKGPTVEPSVVERALADAAGSIADVCDKKLAELIVHHLIEEPRFRLAGAEEALRHFSAIAEQSLQAHEQLAKELGERTISLYHKIHKIFDAPVPTVSKPITSIWKGAFTRKTPGNKPSLGTELVEALKNYAKCCYQSLVLQHITRLYTSLRGLLSDQVREVGFCRTRLRELAVLVAGNGKESDRPEENTREKYLLPESCVDLKDVIEKMEERIGPADLLEFDVLVQHLLQQQFQALVHVCMGPANLVRNLAPVLLHEAVRFLEPLLEGTNAAEMYLAQHSQKGQVTAEVKEEVQAIFNATAARLTRTVPPSETAIITLPGGEAGDRLRNLFHAGAPQAFVLTSPRPDEILFFREQGPLSLHDLEQFGPQGEEAYRKQKLKDPTALHSREDIPEWQLEKVGQ